MEVQSKIFRSFHQNLTPQRSKPFAANMFTRHQRYKSTAVFDEKSDNDALINFQHSTTDLEKEAAAIYRNQPKVVSRNDGYRPATANTAMTTMTGIACSPMSRLSKGIKVMQPGFVEEEVWTESSAINEKKDWQQQLEISDLNILEDKTPKRHKKQAQSMSKSNWIDLPPLIQHENVSRNTIRQTFLMKTPQKSQPVVSGVSTIHMPLERQSSIPFHQGDRGEPCDRFETEEEVAIGVGTTVKEDTVKQPQTNQTRYFFDRGIEMDEIDEEVDEEMDVGKEDSKESSQLLYDFELLGNDQED